MALVAALFTAGAKPGDLKEFSGDITADQTLQEPEKGWLYGNGALASRTTYSKLFAEIGHTHNGGVDPGGGLFRLPDYRDKSILASGSLASRPGGATGGSVGHRHTAVHAHTQSHVHDMTHSHDMSSHTHSATTGGMGGVGAVSIKSWVSPLSQRAVAGGEHNHSFTTGGPSPGSTGSTSPSSTGADATNTGNDVATVGGGTPLTDTADPPHQVTGGVLVRYA